MNEMLKAAVESLATKFLGDADCRTIEIAAMATQGYDMEGLLEMTRRYNQLAPGQRKFAFEEWGTTKDPQSPHRLVISRVAETMTVR